MMEQDALVLEQAAVDHHRRAGAIGMSM